MFIDSDYHPQMKVQCGQVRQLQRQLLYTQQMDGMVKSTKVKVFAPKKSRVA